MDRAVLVRPSPLLSWRTRHQTQSLNQGCGWFPIKLDGQQAVGWIWPLGLGLGPLMATVTLHRQPFKSTFLFGQRRLWSHGHPGSCSAGLPHVRTLPRGDSCQRPAARPLPRRNLNRDTFHRNGQRDPQHATCPTSTPVAFRNEKTISNQSTQHRAPVCFRRAAWPSGQGRCDFRPARRLALCTRPFT